MSPLEDNDLLINVIVEDLTSWDRKKAIYLCGSFAVDSSLAHFRETLRAKVDRENNPPLFIKSVLCHLGRYDILKRVYNVGRKDVEKQIQTYGQVLPRFRVLMVTINDDLDADDLEQIQFLLSRNISREKIKHCKTFLDLASELERQDSVSPERIDLIEECLRNIGRLDLVNKVTAYKMSAATSEHSSIPQQSGRAFTIEQRPTQHIAASVKASLPVCREPSCKVELAQYNLTANPRGVCVIFDCVGKDGEMLEKTFKALHFNVVLHPMMGADEILQTLKEISRCRETREWDAFVCCIISRSMANSILGTNMHGSGLSVETVRGLFIGDACPSLAGKPKLFFIQSYSVPEFGHLARGGYPEGSVEADACHLPIEADVFWSQCWTDECQLQQEQHRSVYLKALNDALSKVQRRRGLLDLHLEVNGAIYDHNLKHPDANYRFDVKHTLRKNLHL